MRPSIGVALLSLGLFTCLGSFGFFLNDEMDLGAAAHNLYRGSLTVDEVPPEYYDYPVLDATPRIRVVGGHGYVAESRAGAVVAAPALALLHLAAFAGTPQLAFVLLASGGIFGGLAVLAWPRWRALGERPRRFWAGGFAAALLAFLAVNVALARDFSLDVWGPPLAMQVSSMVLTALGIGALHRLVTLRMGATAAHLAAVVLLGGTTIASWAYGQKYHAPQVAFLCIVAFLRFAPGHATRAWAASYAVAGLAIWFHAKAGGLLLASLLVVDGITYLRRSSRPADALRTASLLGLALAVGIVPYAVENALIFGSPVAPGYTAIGVIAADAAAAEPVPNGTAPDSADLFGGVERSRSMVVRTIEYVKQTSVLRDLSLWPDALFQAFLVPEVQTISYGLLMVAPLLVLAPLGVWRAFREREASHLELFFGVHAALVLMVYGLHVLQQGGGDEPRFYTILYPALVWYSVRYARDALGSALREFAITAAVLTPLGVGFCIWTLSGRSQSIWTYVHFQRELGLGVLVLMVLAVVGGGVVSRWRPDLGGWVARGRAAVWAMGFIPSAWFLVQTCLLYPRFIWAGVPGGPLAMFLPTSDLVRAYLHGFLTLYPKVMGDPAFANIFGF